MSVSGYSTIHDPEVQQYNAMRAEFRAQKLTATAARGESSQQGNKRGVLRRILSLAERRTGVGKSGKAVTASKGRVAHGDKGEDEGDEEEEDEEGWCGSDAETEIDLTEALNGEKGGTTTRTRRVEGGGGGEDGMMKEKKRGKSGEKEGDGKMARRIERAPPYVYLSALPGVTVSRKAW